MALTAKERRAALRQSVVFGGGMGLLIFCLIRYAVMQGMAPGGFGTRDFLFGDLASKPQFLSGYLPLDIAVGILSSACMWWSLALLPGTNGSTARFSLQLILMMSAGTASVCSPMLGWFRGLEFGVAIAIVLAASVLVLGGAMALVIGVGYMLLQVCRAIWSRLRMTPIGKIILRFNRFLEGEKYDTSEAAIDQQT